MSLSKPFQILLLVAIAVCLSPPASAGTVRDDLVPDPLNYPLVIDPLTDPYLALSTQYPSGGALLSIIPSLPDPFLFASGTLIAPDWVLTAAHAVIQSAPYPLHVYIGGNTYVVTHRIVHPDFDGNPFSGYDIGLLRLQGPVTGITPAKRYTSGDELGQVGTMVGFGYTGTGLTGILAIDGYRRAGQNMIDAWLDYGIDPHLDDLLDMIPPWGVTFPNERIFLTDFDQPGDPSKSVMGNATPLALECLVASGDSGGGVFIQNNEGEDLLAGIHSFDVYLDYDPQDPKLADYGDISGHTRVSEFNDWINATIPEPGSFIVWSLLIGLGMTVGWRRRRGAS